MTDVLIAGAGPTGLTLAIDLARRGVHCRIIDRGAGPQPGSRGFGLKPRTLEVFDDLGVAERIMRASRTPGHTRVHLGEPLLFDLPPVTVRSTERRRYPASRALPQYRVEAVLRDRLAELGGAVEFGCVLTDLRQDATSVTATFTRDGVPQTVRADYLVGCDGGGSTVRKSLGVRFEGRTDSDSQALLADVRIDGLAHADAVHLWMTGGHMLAIRPAAGTEEWQVVASLDPDTPQDAELSADALRRIVAQRTGRTDIRLAEPSWLSRWRYNLRIADRYRVGRVFLAGDAAHVHSPFGAFGLNTGVQDAYDLGWKLACAVRGQASGGLLDSYQAERLPVGRAILTESDRRFTAATTPPAVLRPVLRFMIRPFLARLQRRGLNDHPDYRRSPLSLDRRRGRRRVRAGDVAPDGRVRLPGTDADRWLSDLYRGPHATLLAFGTGRSDTVRRAARRFGDRVHAYQVVAPGARPGSPSGEQTGTVLDVGGRVRRRYGVRNGVVLVRPDGYLGLVADRAPDDLLAEYLGRVFTDDDRAPGGAAALPVSVDG